MSLLDLLEAPRLRRDEARREFADRLADLIVLRRFDEHRTNQRGDYGAGQRLKEIQRRARELEELRVRAQLGAGAIIADPPAAELRRAFVRVGRQRIARAVAADVERPTPQTRRTIKAWELTAAELELRVDNPR